MTLVPFIGVRTPADPPLRAAFQTDRMLTVPGRADGRLLLPTSDRRAATLGLTLMAPNRRRARLAHSAVRALLLTLGPHALGRAMSPRRDPRFDRLLPAVCEALTAESPFDGAVDHQLQHADGVAAVVPRQPQRDDSIALLLFDGPDPVAFVKAAFDDTRIDREIAVMRGIGGGSAAVSVPGIIAASEPGAHLAWYASTPALSDGRRVDAPPDGWRRTLELERLAPLLGPRPNADDVVVHGDLAPWNLRTWGGRVAIVDWELVGWGPDGADEAFFALCRALLDGRPCPPTTPRIAEFLRERLTGWAENPANTVGETAHAQSLLELLRSEPR